jgi:RHS repeat-associated protein
MTTACNPETSSATCTTSPLPTTGLQTYTYDASGNMLTKTDARGVTTTWSGYDGLNRPQGKSYTLNNSPQGTPPVTYGYDVGWKGALSSVSASVGSSVYSTSYGFDGFGRVTSSSQTTVALPAYAFSYIYSYADELTQIQYPSSRTLNYTPDSAGRIISVQSGTSGPTYAGSIGYTPAGAISTLTLGNGVVENYSWNDRLQFTGLMAAKSGTNLLSLGLFPCGNPLATFCTTGNIGGVQGQTITVPSLNGVAGLTLTQNYVPDTLNRVSTANETPSSWSQGYLYDPNGNRYVNPTASSGFSLSAFTPTAPSNFNAANQLLVDNSAFDPSGDGNQTAMGGSGGYIYSYDAENRITEANQAGLSSTGYVYDGQGQRVQKIFCPAGTPTCTAAVTGAASITYVYDADGNLAAEYGSAPNTAPVDCGTCYLSVDQVGSTRMVTDSGGNVVRRYDYLPWGEELFAGIGGRTTAQGYQTGQDGFNPKFTGQARDTESSLDYFNARYYSPQQGRFLSSDPENAGADPSNPLTWNGYSYVGNNPLALTDPSGESWFSILAGIFVGLVTLDPAAGLAAESFFTGFEDLANGQPPWDFSLSMPGVGDFTGCGGPLGNCGGSSTDPWTEQLPIGPEVIDPSRFINDIIDVQAGGGQADYDNYFSALSYLSRDPGMKAIIRHLRSSSTVYHLEFVRHGQDGFYPLSNTVYWDPTSSLIPTSGGCQSAALGLGHEFAHADSSRILSFIRGVIPAGVYTNREELRVVTGPETSAARTLGESVRHDHDARRLTRDPRSTSRECR